MKKATVYILLGVLILAVLSMACLGGGGGGSDPTKTPAPTKTPIPTATEIPDSCYYEVKLGDNLTTIAQANGFYYIDLAILNGIPKEQWDNLDVGQKLLVCR